MSREAQVFGALKTTRKAVVHTTLETAVHTTREAVSYTTYEEIIQTFDFSHMVSTTPPRIITIF